MDLWAKTSGTWINVVAILLGTAIGIGLKTRLPKSMQVIVTQSVGLITLFLGFSMTSSLTKVKAGHVDTREGAGIDGLARIGSRADVAYQARARS